MFMVKLIVGALIALYAVALFKAVKAMLSAWREWCEAEVEE